MPKSDEFERGTGGGTKISGFGPPPDHRYHSGLNSGNLFLFVFGWGSLKTHFFTFQNGRFLVKFRHGFRCLLASGGRPAHRWNCEKKLKKHKFRHGIHCLLRQTRKNQKKTTKHVQQKVDSKRSDSAPVLCTVFIVFWLREDPPEHRQNCEKKTKNISFGTVFIVF